MASLERKENGAYMTAFYGRDDGTWEPRGRGNWILGFRRHGFDWEMIPSMVLKNEHRNFSVEGARETHQGFQKAMREIVNEYPEVLDFVLQFDGPYKPVRDVLVGEVSDMSRVRFLHGTSMAAWQKVQSEGLRPRSVTHAVAAYGQASSAKEGRPDAVYLTTQETMARFAARDAARAHKSTPVVLEVVGIDPKLAAPDEDSGEDTAEASLARLGSIAYLGSVEPENIRSLGWGERTENPVSNALESTILNLPRHSALYLAATSWERTGDKRARAEALGHLEAIADQSGTDAATVVEVLRRRASWARTTLPRLVFETAPNPTRDDIAGSIADKPMLPEHVKARLEQEDKPQVLEWYSLCTEDCEHGYHVPVFKTCQRCGAQIHKTVVEVYDPGRGEITVGSECIKDVMGWKWGKSHENALSVQAVFDQALVEMGTPIAIVRKYDQGRLLVQTAGSSVPYDGLNVPAGEKEPFGTSWKMVRGRAILSLPSAWNDNLLRAGADLSLPWRKVVKDDYDHDGHKRSWYHEHGSGPGWFVGVRGTMIDDELDQRGWRVRSYTKIIAAGRISHDEPGWSDARAALLAGRAEAQNDHVEILTMVGPWVRSRYDHDYWSGSSSYEIVGMNAPSLGSKPAAAKPSQQTWWLHGRHPVVGSDSVVAKITQVAPGRWQIVFSVGAEVIARVGAIAPGQPDLTSLAQVAEAVEQILPRSEWNDSAGKLLGEWLKASGPVGPSGPRT